MFDISQDQFEIANILNKCIQDVFVIEEIGERPYFESRVHNYVIPFTDLLPVEITYKDVLNRLQNLDQN